jgi:CubicO group peptidase (beta-lactamase class C family)
MEVSVGIPAGVRLPVAFVLLLTFFIVVPHHTSIAAEAARDLAMAPPQSVGVDAERVKRIGALARSFVDQGRLSGVVTMLSRHGKVVDVTVQGKKDIRKPDPMQADSIFRIASMTKPITGVAMMMLYEEGKWRLNDPVSRYIPEFSKLSVYLGENPDGSLKTEDARRSMTMRELMTHTAGLGYTISATNPVDRMYRANNVFDTRKPLQALIDNLAKMPLQTQPGTRWSYSIGVDVQGYLVEKLSGLSFDEFLRTRIFEPLGMKDTAFYVPAEKISRLALVHGSADGKATPPSDRRGDPTVKPVGASGGGGLYSTAADYTRVCEMLLEGGQFNGKRLLAPRTVEMMRTNHVNPEPLKTMPQGTGWGMDFQVIMDAAAAGEPTSTGTFSWWGINGTFFWIDPVRDLSFVAMIQTDDLGTAGELRGLARNVVYQAVTN